MTIAGQTRKRPMTQKDQLLEISPVAAAKRPIIMRRLISVPARQRTKNTPKDIPDALRTNLLFTMSRRTGEAKAPQNQTLPQMMIQRLAAQPLPLPASAWRPCLPRRRRRRLNQSAFSCTEPHALCCATIAALGVGLRPCLPRRRRRRLRRLDLVELSGIEPLTPCLQSRCSPS